MFYYNLYENTKYLMVSYIPTSISVGVEASNVQLCSFVTELVEKDKINSDDNRERQTW